MIEFKAECGHTVRAKDEDAGGVVRCSYCGRTAAVPENEKNDLSFLFKDVEQQPASARRKRSRLGGFFRKRSSGSFNPFSFVFRLCYVALLVIALVVVIRKFVMPMFDPETRTRRLAAAPEAGGSPASDSPGRGSTGSSQSRGLMGVDFSSGMYVASSPPGAQVYCIEESRAPAGGRLTSLPNSTRFQANTTPPRLSDGLYVVEVVFAWNDPRLSDPSLPYHNQYVQFRRAVEKASASARTQLLNQYFLPDEASSVFVDETPDQIYLVRQYRSVPVRQGHSPGVRALFLPRIEAKDAGVFAIEPLLHGYIPSQRAYNFDEVHVTSELAYYGVTPADQPHVIQALARIGLVPYVTPDGMVRLFKIGIHDGVFATRLLGAAKP